MNRTVFHAAAMAALLFAWQWIGQPVVRAQAPHQHSDSGDAAAEPQEASDAVLEGTVRQAILEDKTLGNRAQNVKIAVRDGQVTLSGQVDTPQQKEKAGERAAQVAGQSHVTNQIELTPLKPHNAYRTARWPF